MEFGIIDKVKEINRRKKIYIPKHKKWVELTKETKKDDGSYIYEVVRLQWENRFEEEGYLEDNFDRLSEKPIPIVYPEPENEDIEGGME